MVDKKNTKDTIDKINCKWYNIIVDKRDKTLQLDLTSLRRVKNIKKGFKTMAKEIVLTEKQAAILAFLQANPGERYTLAEISAAVGFNVAPGTITKMVKFDGVMKGDLRTVEYVATKEVNTYGI